MYVEIVTFSPTGAHSRFTHFGGACRSSPTITSVENLRLNTPRPPLILRNNNAKRSSDGRAGYWSLMFYEHAVRTAASIQLWRGEGSTDTAAPRHASPSPLPQLISRVHLRRLLVPLYFSLEHGNAHLRPLILTARNNDNNGEPRGSREVFSSMVTSCATRRPPLHSSRDRCMHHSRRGDRQYRENATTVFIVQVSSRLRDYAV